MKKQPFNSTWEKAKDVAACVAIAVCVVALGVIACLIMQAYGAAVLG